MRKAIKFIPNFITLCNILCGSVAIYYAVLGDFRMAFWLMITAAVLDFADGLAARVLNARSEIGLQLDSLCDVVSFGVLPALMAFMWLKIAVAAEGLPDWLAFVGLAIAPFAALRLAIFNVDTEQTTSFRGLPTPAMALMVASMVTSFEPSMIVGVCTIALLCILMVSRVPMLSFKFKKVDFGAENLARYVLILATIPSLVFIGVYNTLALIISLYIAISIAMSWRTR